jgi:hypothetical protein
MTARINRNPLAGDDLMAFDIDTRATRQLRELRTGLQCHLKNAFGTTSKWLTQSPNLRLILAVLCLSIVLHLSEKNLRRSCRLPEQAYFSSVVIVGGIKESLAFFSTFLCSVLGAVLYRRRRWNGCTSLFTFRYLVLASAVTLAWAASSYPYNHYFNQSHIADRVMIILLFLGLIRWPSLVGIFAVYAFAILSQFDQPFGGFSWTDKDLSLRVLLMFGASLWLSVTSRSRELLRVALLMTFALIASHYFVPGWEKLTSGWLSYGNLHHLFAAAHVNGWLNIDSLQVTEHFYFTRKIEPWLLVATVILECGAIALLANRYTAIALLLGWAGLHIGIFAFSGICFWKWVIIDCVAAAALISMPAQQSKWLFGGIRPWLAFFLIAFGQPVFKPHHLAWFDTPLAHTYRFVAIDASGNRHPVGKYQLAPYDFFLCQNRLWFIPQSQVLTRTWSSTKNKELAEMLAQCKSISDLSQIEPTESIVQPSPDKLKGFERWVFLFFKNMTTHPHPSPQGLVGFPQHIWTTPHAHDFQPSMDIVAVEIFRTSSWCQDNAITVIEDIALMRVNLASDSTLSTEYFHDFTDHFPLRAPSDVSENKFGDFKTMHSPPTVTEAGALMFSEGVALAAGSKTVKR